MAEYRNKIQIQRLTVTTDDDMNEVEAWEDYYSCKAEMKTEQGNSFWGAQAAGYERSMNIYIRYCEKAKAIIPVLYRVVYNDNIIEIISTDNVNEKNREIRIKGVIRK